VSVLRFLARVGVRLFFDHVEIEGLENVPREGPLLVVSNHTNGLVDGLMLLAALPRPVSLTAKSTLRKNPLLALLMRLGGVVPFYRRQDNVDVTKNVDSFAAIKERLARGEAVCIFPEGVSHSDASMRELKSGAARIAHESNTPILPIGLHYDAKQRFRSSVLVRIGTPMNASSTTDEIRERIAALTTNFRRLREALWLRWTAELLETRGEDPKPLDQEETAVAARARLIAQLRDAYEHADRETVLPLFAAMRAYRRDLRRYGIAPAEVYLSMHPAQAMFFVVRELELLIVGGAIVAVGLLQHGLALLLDRTLTKALSTDLDHWASNAIFYGLAIFPLTWIVGLIAVWVLGSPMWALAYTVLLPFTLVYTMMWWPRAASAMRRARTFMRFLFDRGAQRDLQQRGRALIATINI
jgi:glycerol-3-phosphate O-acyltransferase/dihydroxyacetone phosphate acyltransferase